MSVRIVFLRSAEQDLKVLRAYIVRNFGHSVWQACYSKIKDAVTGLKDFPLCGSMPDELQSLSLTQYRQVISGMNRIIYEYRQGTVYIHVVCDTRKDMLTLLRERLLLVV